MDSQYSEENSMESHTEDDNSITTEERDENGSEEEQSSITTENSSEEELDDILQALLMEGHDESEAKQEAFAQILPVFQKELGDVYMNNLVWMKAFKKDPIHKKIMATRDDYVNNNMFDPDEAIAAAVKKRKFLLKRLLEDQGFFPEQ